MNFIAPQNTAAGRAVTFAARDLKMPIRRP
jgi:hypothetical protein